MGRSLLDITDDMQALDDLLNECGGDISDPRVCEAIEAWTAELDKDLRGKVDSYAAYISELRGRAKVRADEAARLSGRAKHDDATADYLTGWLKTQLEARGMKTVETDRYRVTVCNNGGKVPVRIVEPAAVPRTYCRIIPESAVPDAEKIRLALTSGETVPGAELGERGTHLRIS